MATAHFQPLRIAAHQRAKEKAVHIPLSAITLLFSFKKIVVFLDTSGSAVAKGLAAEGGEAVGELVKSGAVVVVGCHAVPPSRAGGEVVRAAAALLAVALENIANRGLHSGVGELIGNAVGGDELSGAVAAGGAVDIVGDGVVASRGARGEEHLAERGDAGGELVVLPHRVGGDHLLHLLVGEAGGPERGAEELPPDEAALLGVVVEELALRQETLVENVLEADIDNKEALGGGQHVAGLVTSLDHSVDPEVVLDRLRVLVVGAVAADKIVDAAGDGVGLEDVNALVVDRSLGSEAEGGGGGEEGNAEDTHFSF